MASNSKMLDISEAESSEFTWDSLPEVVKERWERVIDYSTTTEAQLAKARTSRDQAELERQRIAKQILASTNEAAKSVVANAKKTLDEIKVKAEKAELNREEAQRLVTEAKTIRAEAVAYRDGVLARADQQAEEILQRSRSAAEAEQARLAKHVSFEAQRMLAQAEAMRAAAREELEAQRIYSEAAMLKADAHEALDELKALLEVSESDFYGNGGEKVADLVIAVNRGSEGRSEATDTEIGAFDATFGSDATEEPSPDSSTTEGGPLDPQQSDDPTKAPARKRRMKTS